MFYQRDIDNVVYQTANFVYLFVVTLDQEFFLNNWAMIYYEFQEVINYPKNWSLVSSQSNTLIETPLWNTFLFVKPKKRLGKVRAEKT